MSHNSTEPMPAKARRKSDSRPTAPSPVSITSILEGWKSMADAHIASCHSPAGASAGAWEIRGQRVRAQAILRELADNEDLLFACIACGVQRPLEWLRDHPQEWPVPLMPIDQMARCDWQVCAFPFDARKMRVVTIDDPLRFLGSIVETTVSAWLANFNGPEAPADGLTRNARVFLEAMFDLKFHDGTRGGQDEIWRRVAEIGDAVEGKSNRGAAVGILKDRKLIDAKPGTGTMLTPQGVVVARSSVSRSNSE